MLRSKIKMPAWNAGLVPRTVRLTLYLSRQAWAVPLQLSTQRLAEMEFVVALLKHKANLVYPRTMVVVKICYHDLSAGAEMKTDYSFGGEMCPGQPLEM